MVSSNNAERPHPAFAQSFRAYANYLSTMESMICARYGTGLSLLDGVHSTVLSSPALHRVQRRPLTPNSANVFRSGLRKGWGFLRRVQREVEDEGLFDEEANALIPYSVWYAVHHTGRALAAASRQTVPNDHVALLHALGRTVVKRGLLPLPWGAWCEGCPQTKTLAFGGLGSVGSVHVLSTPTPGTTEDRIGLALRTTREKDLDRAFERLRKMNLRNGQTRRNLKKADKERHADTFAPTTIFDFLYRLRTRASYGEADLFVLGSRDEYDARSLALSLAVVCDATVAALEALICVYAGPVVLAEAAEEYTRRTNSTLVARRAEVWRGRCPKPRAPVAPSMPPADSDVPF